MISATYISGLTTTTKYKKVYNNSSNKFSDKTEASIIHMNREIFADTHGLKRSVNMPKSFRNILLEARMNSKDTYYTSELFKTDTHRYILIATPRDIPEDIETDPVFGAPFIKTEPLHEQNRPTFYKQLKKITFTEKETAAWFPNNCYLFKKYLLPSVYKKTSWFKSFDVGCEFTHSWHNNEKAILLNRKRFAETHDLQQQLKSNKCSPWCKWVNDATAGKEIVFELYHGSFVDDTHQLILLVRSKNKLSSEFTETDDLFGNKQKSYFKKFSMNGCTKFVIKSWFR
jgi:hypothetical protein